MDTITETTLKYWNDEEVARREHVEQQLAMGVIVEDTGEDVPIEEVLEHLPYSLAQAILSVNERTNLPLELCLQTALACANLVTQAHYNVHAIGWNTGTPTSIPLTEFFIVLQQRSGGKSTVYDEFFGPLDRARSARQKLYEDEMEQYNFDDVQYKKAVKAGDTTAVKPVTPRGFWPIVSNPTLNGLIVKLTTTPVIGIISDEGSKFINSHDNQTGASGASLAASLCNLWNAKPIERLTGMDDNYIFDRRCNLFLMVQKDLAAKLVSNDQYNSGGLESRMLVVDSPSWVLAEDETGGDRKDMDDYYARIIELFMQDLPTNTFDNKRLEPAVLRWDDDSKAVALVDLRQNSKERNANNRRAELDGFIGYGDGIISKGHEHACKLAGTICAYDGRESISMSDWTAAQVLVRFYVQQRQKIGVIVDPDRVGKAAKAEEEILRWLRKVTQTDLKKGVYQSVLEANGPVSYTKYLEPDQRQRLLLAMMVRGKIEFDGKFIKLCE